MSVYILSLSTTVPSPDEAPIGPVVDAHTQEAIVGSQVQRRLQQAPLGGDLDELTLPLATTSAMTTARAS